MPEGFLVSATNVPRLLAPVAAGAARAAVPWLWLHFHTVAVLGGVSGGFPTHPAGCPLSSSCLQIFPSGLCSAVSQSSLSWRIFVRLVSLVTRYFAGANNNLGAW